MTATCLVPLARRSSSAGRTVNVVMRSGNRMVEMMKARVRTRSTNSRRTTARILRMDHLVRRCDRCLGAYLRAEDPGGAVTIPGEGQSDMTATELSLDARERAVHHFLSSSDDHDVIAHPFRLLHDVR